MKIDGRKRRRRRGGFSRDRHAAPAFVQYRPVASEVRINLLKRAIGEAKRLPEAERDKVLASFGDEQRRRVREAPLLAWADVSVFLAFNGALDDALGTDRAREFWKAYLLDALNRPLLKPLRVGAITVYGRAPDTLLRRAPQAWALVSRGCGVIAVDLAEGRATLDVSELPEAMCQSPSVVSFWQGGAEACVSYFDCPVVSAASAAEIAGGRVRVELSWSSSDG
jgi:hypothetical protein